ncbi:MAG TPA: 50S ribosomal protein L31 [Gammaproteobacteria bacterium]|nr:50S ribosomal protein L31 [Gammaproteobacteria bacterium]
MKKDIHPSYEEVTVVCSCGHSFVTRSTIGKKVLQIETCSSCHDFYTGKKKSLENVGRVSRFRQKYGQGGGASGGEGKKEAAQ